MPPKRRVIDLGSSDSEDEIELHNLRRAKRTKSAATPAQLCATKNHHSHGADYLTMNLASVKMPEEVSIITERQEKTEQEGVITSMPKGFAMMQKMGFNIGQGLGTGQTNAIKTPIKAVYKTGKRGIGEGRLDDLLHGFQANSDQYQKWVQSSREQRSKERTLTKMQKLAFEMSGDIDTFSNSSDPRNFNCLWRRHIIYLQMRSRNANDLPECGVLANSLRVKDDGVRPDKEETLSTERDQVGLVGKNTATSKDENVQLKIEKEKSEPPIESSDEELRIFEDLEIDEKILRIHIFLKAEFHYCFYCGTKYTDELDMAQYCPGLTEEEHI